MWYGAHPRQYWLQLLVKHTGLSPESIVSWINARPVVGVHAAIFGTIADNAYQRQIFEHFVATHIAYVERRDSLQELIRRNQDPERRGTDLLSYDLMFNDAASERVGFVRGPTLIFGGNAQTPVVASPTTAETEIRYLQRILSHDNIRTIK